jgi:hypothetical protein
MEPLPFVRTKHIPEIIPTLKVPRLNYYLRNKFFIPYDDSQGQGAQRYFLREELYVIGILHTLTEKGIDLKKNIIPAFEKNRGGIVDLIKTAFPDDILIIRGDTVELSKKEYIVPVGKKGDWTPVILLPIGNIIQDINDRIEKRRQLIGKLKKRILAERQANKK